MKLLRSRHLAQDNWLSRRTFLAALGLGISVPTALKMSQMAVAAPGDRPNRLLIYLVPNGAPVEHYEPGEGMNLNTGEGILAPLEPFRKYLTVVRGAGNNVADNHESIRSTITGSDDKDDSIDSLVAQQLGTTAHVLGVQSYRANSVGLDHDSKFARQGAYVTPILNPADALDDLFAGLQDTGGSGPMVASDADFRKEAIALTEGEVAAMQSSLSSLTNESNKLQVHLDSLRALKAASSGEGVIISCDSRPSMPEIEALAGVDPFAAAHFTAILDGHLEAVARAFTCGSARVATIQCMYTNAQIMMNFAGGPGLADNHHDPLSHGSVAEVRAPFAQAQRWFYQRLADKFLALLDTPDPEDPEHTVLDNTTVLACSEMADGQLHNSHAGMLWNNLSGGERFTYLPWNIIGGGGGFFSGGRVATIGTQSEGLDHRHVLGAIAESMGVMLPTIAGLSVSTPTELKA